MKYSTLNKLASGILFFILLISAMQICLANEGSGGPKGAYLGQDLPADIPVKFAPGIISTNIDEYRLTISPSGEEIAFTRAGVIMITRKNNAGSDWTEPAPAFAPFDSEGGEPCFSADGEKLYFCSRRSLPEAKKPLNAWVSKKTDGKWSKPYHLGIPVINQTVHAYSVTQNGSIYCTGITFIECIDGKYVEAKKLNPAIQGSHPFIAPDESYIIFDKRGENSYAADLYVTFKKNDGDWTEPLNLGPKVNTKTKESNASISPDGKFLFISRDNDIYWVKADFITDLKKMALSK